MDKYIQICKNVSLYMYVYSSINFILLKGRDFFPSTFTTLYSEYSKVPGT